IEVVVKCHTSASRGPVLEWRAMFKALGIENRRELGLFLAMMMLIALTPLGREATAAPVLVLYRLLLLTITIGSLALLRSKAEPEVCPFFVALCGLVMLIALASVFWNPGSRFDGFYRWYQLLLFGAAFIAMTLIHRERGSQWKTSMLWTVI